MKSLRAFAILSLASFIAVGCQAEIAQPGDVDEDGPVGKASSAYVTTSAVGNNRASIIRTSNKIYLNVFGGSRGDNAAVGQWGEEGKSPLTLNEIWYLRDRGYGYFAIEGADSHKCLTPGWNKTPGAKITQWTCSGNDDQTWYLERIVSDGLSTRYAIANKYNGQYLDVPSNTNAWGTQLQTYWNPYAPSFGPAQLFYIQQ